MRVCPIEAYLHAYKHILSSHRHIHDHILSSKLILKKIIVGLWDFHVDDPSFVEAFSSIERESTPRRALRAARSSVFTEWQTSTFSSVVLMASHTLSDIPGPKSGLTVLTHSPWFFLNSYLCFAKLASSGANVYIRTVFSSRKIHTNITVITQVVWINWDSDNQHLWSSRMALERAAKDGILYSWSAFSLVINCFKLGTFSLT